MSIKDWTILFCGSNINQRLPKNRNIRIVNENLVIYCKGIKIKLKLKRKFYRRYHLVTPLLAPVKAPTDQAGVARPHFQDCLDHRLFQIFPKRHKAQNLLQRGRAPNYRMSVPLMAKLSDTGKNQSNQRKFQQMSHRTPIQVFLHLHNRLLHNPALQIPEQIQRLRIIHPPAHLHPTQAQKEKRKNPGCPVPYLPTTSQDAMKFEKTSRNCLQMKCWLVITPVLFRKTFSFTVGFTSPRIICASTQIFLDGRLRFQFLGKK